MAALDDYIRSFTPRQDVFGAFNEAYGFQNAIQQQRNAMARQQQADAMRQQEFGMRRQEYEGRLAEQRRQQQQQEDLQNAMSLAAQGRQVSMPWDEVMAGPSFGEQDITAQVPYSYEEQVGMLAPYLGPEKFLEMRKPQDPYEKLPADIRARMLADQDPRVASVLQAEDDRKMRQAKAGAASVSVNTGEKGFKHERELRNDFRSEPIVKDYNIVAQQTERLDAALAEYNQNKSKGGSNVAVDQTLITVFNKMLDPTSVVRESEYARTSQDISMLNRIKGKWEKVVSGGAGLTEEERRAMVTMAKRFAGIAKQKYNDTRKEYARAAKKWDFDPSYIVGNEPDYTPAPPAAVDHLMKNPQLKDAFKTKYGYLPEGL